MRQAELPVITKNRHCKSHVTLKKIILYEKTVWNRRSFDGSCCR